MGELSSARTGGRGTMPGRGKSDPETMHSIESAAMPLSTMRTVASCFATVSALAGLALATGSWSHGLPIPGTWARPPELDGRTLGLILILAAILVTGLRGLRASTNAARADPRARSVGLLITAS